VVHALGEEESVCQRQELGWYRGIFVPDTFKENVSGIFYCHKAIRPAAAGSPMGNAMGRALLLDTGSHRRDFMYRRQRKECWKFP
jgi:hypothetical protein